MRILLTTDTYHPVVSGVTTVVQNLCNELQSLGHEVGLIAPASPNAKPAASHRTAHFFVFSVQNPIRPDHYIPIPLAYNIRQHIDTFAPDIIHIHTPGPIGLAAQKIARQKHIPVVGTVHGVPGFVTSYLPLSTPITDAMQDILWTYNSRYTNSLNYVIAPSAFIMKELKSHGVRNAFSVIPMWIDPPTRPTPKLNIRTTLGIPRNAHVFGFFGRIDPDKNLDIMLEAAQKLALQYSNRPFHLLFAGQGTQIVRLRKRAAALGIARICHFTGFVAGPKIPNIFAAIDTFIMPSPVEAQSLTSLQAVQAGLPVILANAGALPEIAKRFPRQTMLFHPHRLASLAQAMRSKLGRRNKHIPPKTFYRHYGKEKHLALLLAAYRHARKHTL